MRSQHQLLFIGLVATRLIGFAWAQDQAKAPDPFTPKGKKAIRAAAEKFRDENKPTSDRVIPEDDYFLRAFNTPRKHEDQTFTMAGSDDKVYIFWEIAKAMKKTANDHGNDPDKVIVEWEKARTEVMDKLSTPDQFTNRALYDHERAVWDQFLDQWEKDAKAAAPERFKDALNQAAYELVKRGLDVQTKQETLAKTSGPTREANSGASASASARPGGYYLSDVIHERMMNHIYRTHHRRMNRIIRIRARGGRY